MEPDFEVHNVVQIPTMKRKNHISNRFIIPDECSGLSGIKARDLPLNLVVFLGFGHI